MKILKLIKLNLLLVITLYIFGCSSMNSQILPKNADYQSTDYLIGAGDQLEIFVWRNSDLSTKVIVRPDGRISSPLVDDLLVSGLPATQVAVEIEKALSTYIRDPKVTIMVSGFKGAPGQQIRVIGNASKPMALPFKEGMTLLDVMIEVQGLTEFADGDNAQLVRVTDGNPVQYTIFLDSLIRGGDISKNRAVYPGDTIIIPESWY